MSHERVKISATVLRLGWGEMTQLDTSVYYFFYRYVKMPKSGVQKHYQLAQNNATMLAISYLLYNIKWM